jgi:hypothetical protein
MPCRHLRELYTLCNTHNLKLSSSDLIRIVCPSCGVTEVCPSLLCEEYDLQHPDEEDQPTGGPKDPPTLPSLPSSGGNPTN